MRIIDKYICKEVFSHALVGLLIFTFVLFVPKLITLMTIVVRHSASASRLGLLFLCVFPYVLTFTLPMAVLVGVLIGLGRMSADSELIALSALGVGLRRVLVPVGLLATFTAGVTLAITLWVGPAAQRTFRQISDELTSVQATYEVQPRVFQEYPGMVLYIQDIDSTATHWSRVLLVQQSDKNTELTLAEKAIVIADREQGNLDLHLNNGSTHISTPGDATNYTVSTFGKSDWSIPLSGLKSESKSTPTVTERTLSDLMSTTGKGSYEARVEIQRRFAFPVACMVFALLAVPLAARPRRGGRAMGFIVSLLLVCAYYLMFIVGAGLAKEGKVSPVLGIWAANFVTGLAGLALLPGMEQIRSSTRLSRWFERVSDKFKGWYESLRGGRRGQEVGARLSPVPDLSLGAGGGKHVHATSGTEKARVIRLRPVRPARLRVRHSSGFPQMLDLYLLRNFWGYFLLVMVGFVFLFEIFTFFELLDNIAKNHTPFFVVLNYFRFLVPFLFYHLSPFAVLVAAMVTLGVMSKNNEVVAIKASGVSLYRLAWPIIGTGAALAAGLLLLSNTYLPYFNQRQDALLNQIRGRPAQTYLNPHRSWIPGASSGTINKKFYNYQIFDAESKPILFGGLNVFELDPVTFQLRRRIHATRAEWSPEQNVWIMKDGWVRDFDADNESHYHTTPFQVYSATELDEPPSHFNRAVRQSDEMSWRELQNYIGELRQSGFDVGRLSVQWQEKLAFPMIAPIIAFLSIPFAFYVGTRGAVGGLALGIGIGIVYWATSALFEALGGVGQMPPVLAGWAPDAIFIFLGTYFFLKMPT